MKRPDAWIAERMKGEKPMWYVLLAIFLMSLLLARAVAQEEKSLDQVAAKAQSRRTIVVSVPDRKLALLENDRVVKTYSVAVGASGSPSPTTLPARWRKAIWMRACTRPRLTSWAIWPPLPICPPPGLALRFPAGWRLTNGRSSCPS